MSVKADETAGDKQGLRAEYYKSSQANYFDQLCKITVDADISFGDLCPKLGQCTGGTSDHTAVRWSGKIQFPSSDEYTLYMIGDNGFRLWMDGRLVIDHWESDWDKEQKSAPIRYEAGTKHAIKIEFFNSSGGAYLKLFFSRGNARKELVPSTYFYLPDGLYVNSDLRFFTEKFKAEHRAATVGTSVGCYPQASSDSFLKAIRRAQALYTKDNATSVEIEREVSALLAERAAFKSTVIKEPFDQKKSGNPVVPGYWADPTIYYDSNSITFFCFATTDGVDGGWQHDPHFAYSKDTVSWEFVPLTLPSVWPLPFPGKPTSLWAPSIARNPKNGKYYLTYYIDSGTYIAYADSPFGPWVNATRGKTPETCRLNDGFDAQLFVDSDGKMYLSHGASEFKLSALKFGPDDLVSIDNSNPNISEGTAYKYKVIHKLNVFGEGTALYKKDGRYYLLYAEYGSQNYCVKYASAKSICGPYAEQPGFIMERDAARDILGPGHVSLFEYGKDTYIGYHRQHFPFVDSKRQTCINRLTFIGGMIGLEVQNHSGMRSGEGDLEQLVAEALRRKEVSLSLGKTVIASSVSDYKGGEFSGESFGSISNFYKASYAVDGNLGTRWMAGSDQTTPSYLIVDLGADSAIGRTETIFEHVRKLYKYKIEYLGQAEAPSIEAARTSTAWMPYADRTDNIKKQSPLVDSKSATARYVKITILSADLPGPGQSNNPGKTDYLNRVSIAEFNIFSTN